MNTPPFDLTRRDSPRAHAVSRPPDGESPNEQIIIGLDIGTSKVCAAVAKRLPDGTAKILGIGQAPSWMSKWGFVNLEETRRAVREALADGEVNAGSMTRDVVLAVKAAPRGRIRNRDVFRDFYYAHEDALFEAEVTSDEITRYLHFADDEEKAIYADKKGARSSAYRAHIGYWNNDRMVEIDKAVLAPTASAEAVLNAHEKDRGALVIDMGAGTTDYAAFVTGELVQSDCLSIGGESIAFDVPPQSASALDQFEKLAMDESHTPIAKSLTSERTTFAKREATRESLKTICHCRVIRIFEAVGTRLVASGVQLDSFLSGVHLTGGYSVFPKIRELAEEVFRLPTRCAHSTGISGPSSDLENPRFACSIGLVKLACRTGA